MITVRVAQLSSFFPGTPKGDKNEKMGQASVSRQGLSRWWFDLCPLVSHLGTPQFSYGMSFPETGCS